MRDESVKQWRPEGQIASGKLKTIASRVSQLKPGDVFQAEIEGEVRMLRLAFFVGRAPARKRGKLVNPNEIDRRVAFCRPMADRDGDLVEDTVADFIQLPAGTPLVRV